MGKRKERRLAAKIGAGRRVKLDLFAEPSGDLGGSSAKDEDGKDVDTIPDRELPNSPSSSGQPLENPLSLLGQYSDDDLDDGANEEATTSDDDKQAKHSIDEPLEEGEIVGVEDHTSQKADDLDVERNSSSFSALLTADADADADAKRDNMVGLDAKDREAAKMERQDHVPVASDSRITQAMSSTWRVVLHEESNRYYYWNTVTRETSWELPDGLAQGTAFVNEIELASVNVNAPAFGVTLDESSAIHGVGYTSEISDMKTIYEPGALVHRSLEQSEADGSQFLGGFSVGALPYAASSLGHYSLSVQANSDVGNLAAGSQQGHDNELTGEQGAVDYPSSLVKNGEALLERLKLLLGSGIDSAEHSLLSKYMLEIEIRLSDIRCLLPYGSSLVPYWLHSDRQLSHLENAINTEIGKQNTKVSVLHASSEEGKEVNQEIEGDASFSTSMRKLSPAITTVHDVNTSTTVQKAVHHEASDSGILNVHQNFPQDSPVDLHPETKVDKEYKESVVHGNASPNPEVQSSEDVDMDIDMEVEDQIPTMNIGGQMAAPSGDLVHPSSPSAGIYLTPEGEPIIPPPPEEEWIPPPPPDEDIPAPPPDEPPESLCPPPPSSELEPSPSIYSEQHNSTFIGPSVNYYGNTITDSLGTSIYEHADVNQTAAITRPPSYYAAVSNAQPISMLNPADSAAYYGIPNGALPVPVPATVGSSNLVAPGHSNIEPLSSEHIGSVDEVVKASSFSKQFVDPFLPKNDIVSTQVSSTSVACAPAAVCTKEYASVPSYSATATSVAVSSTSAAISDASAAVSKVQSKASRVKKPKVAVASSLRSNKKVSSLVDKWNAAKEELREEEKEERETPLEILEKKKQREIEGWRAQQIASGEAKENSNFQPLGGDWREHVKRKRAQKEAAAGTTLDNASNETKHPDLSEISRGLPTGWQACWDDSSRMVYYANLVTSETTWTRPTS